MPLFHKQFSDEVFASTELGNVVRMTSKAKYSPLPCLSAEIERNLISQRTKEALARKKAEGVILGRPKGSKNMKKKLSGPEATTWNCKILLLKFNTWKQGQIEREKGSLMLFDNTIGGFLAQNFCRYGVIASPLHRNGSAVSP